MCVFYLEKKNEILHVKTNVNLPQFIENTEKNISAHFYPHTLL